MYSDKHHPNNHNNKRWDNVRSYYQQQGGDHGAGTFGQEADVYGKRRRSGASSSNNNHYNADKERQEIKESVVAIVQRSGILGIKKEKWDRPSSSAAEFKEDPGRSSASSTSSSLAILENPQQNRFKLLESDSANSLLPAFDQLANFPPAVQCKKFFEDIQPLDRILARIVRTGVAILHVELVCTLTRFRRDLLAFMKGKLIPVEFDRTKRFYQVNDYVSTTVMAISPNMAELELQLDEEEAIFTHQGIPAYSRDFGPTSFDKCRQISHLRDNPNLCLQLAVPINTQHSAIPALAAKHLHLAASAEQIRREQTAKLAMGHVVKGAELTRENKCFEAIQCFNKALAVDAECADAFVGRGAACAGMRNFDGALVDFDRAIELQPTHRNANKYRLEVLMAFGRDLEKTGELKEARSKFERILELWPGHSGALEALERMSMSEQPQVVELSDEEEEEGRESNHRNGFGRRSRSDTMTEEEARQNRQKLNDMEEFIRKLKAKK